MITKHEPPMNFKVIDEKRFQEWASATKMPPCDWYDSIRKRTPAQQRYVGLERMSDTRKTRQATLSAMREAVWRREGLTIRRRIVAGRYPKYLWIVSGKDALWPICDSPLEVLNHYGMIVE